MVQSVMLFLQNLVEDRRHISLGERRLSYAFIRVVDGSLWWTETDERSRTIDSLRE